MINCCHLTVSAISFFLCEGIVQLYAGWPPDDILDQQSDVEDGHTLHLVVRPPQQPPSTATGGASAAGEGDSCSFSALAFNVEVPCCKQKSGQCSFMFWRYLCCRWIRTFRSSLGAIPG